MKTTKKYNSRIKKYPIGGIIPLLSVLGPLAQNIFGMIGQQKQMKQAEKDSILNSFSDYNTNPFGTNNFTAYQKGGDFINYNGKTHAQGGIGINKGGMPDEKNKIAEVEDKEVMYKKALEAYIYSNRIPSPDGKGSVADKAKRIKNKYKKKKDSVSLKTKDEELKRLALHNEKNKKQRDAKTFEGGGVFDPLVPDLDKYLLSTGNRNTLPETPTPGIYKNPNAQSRQSGVNFNNLNTFALLAKAAPLVHSGIEALKKPEEAKQFLPNYRGNKLLGNLGISPSSILNEANLAKNTANQAIRGSVGNYGQYSNRVRQNMSTAYRNAIQGLTTAKQYNDQVAFNTANTINRQEEVKAQERVRRDIAQSQNDAARRMATRKFFSDLSQVGTTLNKVQYARDEAKNNKEIAQMKVSEFIAANNVVNPNFQIMIPQDKKLSELTEKEWGEIIKYVK